MTEEIAESVGLITQWVRPALGVTVIDLGDRRFGVSIFHEMGSSSNCLLVSLDEFADWMARQQKAGYTACI